MATSTNTNKTACVNPASGGKINIDKSTYDLFAKAIHHTLKKQSGLTYTEMVQGIHDYLKKESISFDGSVGWYAVTVKNDLLTKGLVVVYKEKNKNLLRLAK